MDPVHRYDEVHSVSDLHIGGSPGFQVFDLGDTLGKLIDHLRQRPKGRQVALVINGDFVDFLAEDPPTYFDPARAADKLDRICKDSAFLPVWKALRRFTRTPDRHLVVTLGNHDLELALPWVSERLLQELSSGQPAARGRVVLSFDGNGFLCDVGGKRVLFVHGNEVDTWNLCDYEHLRRLGRDLTQGRRVEEWTPNAGAKMVIDVMNSIKKRYPFIDLLKPETEGAVPVLLAIDPSQASKMRKVLPIVGRRAMDATRKRFGFLSAEEDPNVGQAHIGEAELQRIIERQLSVSSVGPDIEELLDRVEDRMENGEDAFQTLDRDRDQEYLSIRGAIWKALTGAKKEEVVREAFQGLAVDPTFNLNHEDQTFKDLDELIGPEIDYVVAGHTHLERKIPRNNGSGTYFNSGTWIRLMRLTDDILDNASEFEKVFRLLGNGRMKDLDTHTYTAGGQQHHLVIRKPAVVSFWTDGGAVRAELQRVDLTTGLPGPREDDSKGGAP